MRSDGIHRLPFSFRTGGLPHTSSFLSTEPVEGLQAQFLRRHGGLRHAHVWSHATDVTRSSQQVDR